MCSLIHKAHGIFALYSSEEEDVENTIVAIYSQNKNTVDGAGQLCPMSPTTWLQPCVVGIWDLCSCSAAQHDILTHYMEILLSGSIWLGDI